MKLQTNYVYNSQRREWIGIVYRGNTVLTIGCEQTEAEIKEWLQNAIKKKPWIPGNPSVPDSYERGTRH